MSRVWTLLKMMTYLDSTINLKVIGKGSFLKKAKKICRILKITDRVKFLGWIDNKDLGNYYRKSYIVIIPSIWPEPFGLVGIEAMANGRPVIAFDVGGIKEWLRDGEAGYLLSEINARKLAAKVEYLFQHKELAEEMGRKGREIVKKNFTPDKYIDKLIKIFENCGVDGEEKVSEDSSDK